MRGFCLNNIKNSEYNIMIESLGRIRREVNHFRDIKVEFGCYLQRCREYAALTQEKMVEALSDFDVSFKALTANTLSRWERGVQSPSDRKRTKIILALLNLNGVVDPSFIGAGVNKIQKKLHNSSLSKALGANNKEILNLPNNILNPETFKVREIHEIADSRELISYVYSLFINDNEKFLHINKKLFTSWLLNPSNLCLIVCSNGQFMGAIISLRLKREAFDNLMGLDDDLKNINKESFATVEEESSSLLLFLHALNTESAAYLISRYYASLIDNSHVIDEVGMFTFQDKIEKFSKKLNLDFFKIKEGVSGYKAPLSHVLSAGVILKMLF